MGIKYNGPSASQVGAEVAEIAKKKLARAKDAWLKGVNDIMQESIDNAPVDKHNLEKAHSITIEERGRKLVARIDVGGTVDGVDVDKYAWVVHDGSYKLGPGSVKKAATGKKVGRKFLDRAIDDKTPDLVEAVKKAVEES